MQNKSLGENEKIFYALKYLIVIVIIIKSVRFAPSNYVLNHTLALQRALLTLFNHFLRSLGPSCFSRNYFNVNLRW